MSDDQTFVSGFTLERLRLLEEAIGTGELTVKYSDKEVTYRSIDDMLKAREVIRRALGLKKPSRRHMGLFGGTRLKPRHSKALVPGKNTDQDDPSVFGEFDDAEDEH